jgi:hypothetical protein
MHAAKLVRGPGTADAATPIVAADRRARRADLTPTIVALSAALALLVLALAG